MRYPEVKIIVGILAIAGIVAGCSQIVDPAPTQEQIEQQRVDAETQARIAMQHRQADEYYKKIAERREAMHQFDQNVDQNCMRSERIQKDNQWSAWQDRSFMNDKLHIDESTGVFSMTTDIGQFSTTFTKNPKYYQNWNGSQNGATITITRNDGEQQWEVTRVKETLFGKEEVYWKCRADYNPAPAY